MNDNTNKMRIFPGGSRPIEIDAITAGSFRGTIGSVIPEILERFGDPEQREFAREPNLVFEQATPDETPLGGGEDWRTFVDRLAESDVELGTGKAHRGGR